MKMSKSKKDEPKKVIVQNYIYGLFDNHDQQIDQTSINEEDDELAWNLFVEFSQHKGNKPSYRNILNPDYGYYVTLLAIEDEEVYEDDI